MAGRTHLSSSRSRALGPQLGVHASDVRVVHGRAGECGLSIARGTPGSRGDALPDGHRGTGTAMLVYLKAPFNSARIFSYTAGKRLLQPWLARSDSRIAFSRLLTQQLCPSELIDEANPL